MVMKQVMTVLLLAMAFSACGKKAEVPAKTAEQAKAERDAVAKAVRDNPLYGDQLKALDKAKETAAAAGEAAKKTEDALKKAEEQK